MEPDKKPLPPPPQKKKKNGYADRAPQLLSLIIPAPPLTHAHTLLLNLLLSVRVRVR